MQATRTDVVTIERIEQVELSHPTARLGQSWLLRIGNVFFVIWMRKVSVERGTTVTVVACFYGYVLSEYYLFTSSNFLPQPT